ncbi:MAG: hypothetical protein CSA74_03450 [Rhodobacterales bacterium]|nr:MAG: hypothetical protein CSA74_03450 [Rhodobacterales bacterium]
MIRVSRLMALPFALVAVAPCFAAEYERSGDWVFYSSAYAADGDVTWSACMVETRSPDGTELMLRLELGTGALSATMSLSNAEWNLGQDSPPFELRAGAGRWVLQGQAEGHALNVAWASDPAFANLLNTLAAANTAVLTTADGRDVAEFSLRGSSQAIGAMTTCAETQAKQGLAQLLAAAANKAE